MDNERIPEITLQILILAGVHWVTSIQNSSPLLISLALTVDSIFSALSFIRVHLYQYDLSHSQILSQLQSLYIVSVIERYIYYLGLAFSFEVLQLIFWSHYSRPIYILLSLTTCPFLLNWLFKNYLTGLHKRIHLEQSKLVKRTVAYQVAYLINVMSITCLNLRPSISTEELIPFFKSTDHALSFFYSFLSNFLIASLVQYTKTSGNKFYSKLIRYFYNYKTGNVFEPTNEKKARENFTYIVAQRRWDKILLPGTLQSIFYIYKNCPENDFVSQSMTILHYELLKLCSIYSITIFLNWPSLAVLISMFLLLYRAFRNLWENNPIRFYDDYKKAPLSLGSQIFPFSTALAEELRLSESYQNLEENPLSDLGILGEILFKVILFLTLHFRVLLRGQILLTILLSEYGFKLIMNRALLRYLSGLPRYLMRILQICFHFNGLNIFLISTCAFIRILSLECLYNWEIVCFETPPVRGQRIILLLTACYTVLNFQNLQRLIFIVFAVVGLVSDYALPHLLVLMGLIYIVLNLIDSFNEITRPDEGDKEPEQGQRQRQFVHMSPSYAVTSDPAIKVEESYYSKGFKSSTGTIAGSHTELLAKFGEDMTGSFYYKKK